MSLVFSEPTIELLKNFAAINSGLAFKKGHVLRTVSPQKTTLVEATIDEEIPQDFCIHDLHSFLAAITINKEAPPKLELDEKNIYIISNNGRSKITYRCCDEAVIVTPPKANVNMTDADVKFNLTREDFSWITKTAAVLSSKHIAIVGDGEKLYLKTLDADDDSSSTDTYEVGTTDKNCQFLFKTENWKIFPGSYEVSVQLKNKGGISSFKNTEKQLQYWIAIEMGSKID